MDKCPRRRREKKRINEKIAHTILSKDYQCLRGRKISIKRAN